MAEGDGLKKVVAGETGTFKVTTKDANGNVLHVGGNHITANLSGAEKITANVVDGKNGTYDASYVPKIVGQYTLDVKLDAAHIHDSPFKVEVVPAGPHAGNTEASGDGIKHGNTDAASKFKIQVRLSGCVCWCS